MAAKRAHTEGEQEADPPVLPKEEAPDLTGLRSPLAYGDAGPHQAPSFTEVEQRMEERLASRLSSKFEEQFGSLKELLRQQRSSSSNPAAATGSEDTASGGKAHSSSYTCVNQDDKSEEANGDWR